MQSNTRDLIEFQPSLPARGATDENCDVRAAAIFQPSLPARGATAEKIQKMAERGISTLAPREGSDQDC